MAVQDQAHENYKFPEGYCQEVILCENDLKCSKMLKSQFWPQNCARRVKKAPKGAGRKKKPAILAKT